MAEEKRYMTFCDNIVIPNRTENDAFEHIAMFKWLQLYLQETDQECFEVGEVRTHFKKLVSKRRGTTFKRAFENFTGIQYNSDNEFIDIIQDDMKFETTLDEFVALSAKFVVEEDDGEDSDKESVAGYAVQTHCS